MNLYFARCGEAKAVLTDCVSLSQQRWGNTTVVKINFGKGRFTSPNPNTCSLYLYLWYTLTLIISLVYTSLIQEDRLKSQSKHSRGR